MIASACDFGSSPSLGTPWGLSEITFSFILARQYPPRWARTCEDIRPRSCLWFFQKEATRECVSSHIDSVHCCLLVRLTFSLRPQHGRLFSQFSLVSSSFQHVMLGQRERKEVGWRACFHRFGGMQGTHSVSCLGAGRLREGGAFAAEPSPRWLCDPHSLHLQSSSRSRPQQLVCQRRGTGSHIELSREGPEVKLLSPSTLSFFFETFPFFFSKRKWIFFLN